LEAAQLACEERDERLIALDEALRRLQQVSPDACRTVEYRYFEGLTTDEIAIVLGVSSATVRRRWEFAKAWLHRELRVDSV
jgi:RNA polymerase sigma factor (sigma-70 family)